MQKLVIVGASLAGLRAAQGARNAGFAGELTLIGAETHPPYNRPPLSKAVLTGEMDQDALAFPLGDLEVTWKLGTAATGLDRESRSVVLDSGEQVTYDRVIVATGARARAWTGPGHELAGVFTLRDRDDALALAAAVAAHSTDRPARVAVIGAGYIGSEVTASLRGLGAQVSLIDVAEQPMLPLGPELGAWAAQLHAAHGVSLHLGTGVAGLIAGPDHQAAGVELADGTQIPADLVVAGLGAIPNVEWLGDSGLTLERGLACDGTLTSLEDPDVLGAGDAISWPHPLAGERVRIEHWSVAGEQGTLAGKNAVLEPAQRQPHTGVPYFWSDQYDQKIQALGFPARAERLELLERSDDGARSVYGGEVDGRLIGAVILNAPTRLMAYRKLFSDPETLDLAEVRARISADAKRLGDPAPVPPT